MRLILHIGGEKTGTTSIQAKMTEAAAELRSQRILWPMGAKCFYEQNHGPIVASLLSRSEITFLPSAFPVTTPSELAAELAEAVSLPDVDRMVISAEWLSSRLRRHHIKTLKTVLPSIDTEILYYARRQDELAIAAFFTDIMSGRPTWIDVETIRRTNRYYNHLLMLREWVNAFGADRITVVDYGSVPGGDIVLDFFRRIGFAPAQYTSERLNETRSLPVVRLIYLLNRYASPRAKEKGKGYLKSLFLHTGKLQRLRQLLPGTTPPWAAPPLKDLLSTDDRHRILERFRADNMAVCKQFGIDLPWHDTVPARPPAPEATPMPSDEALLAAAITDLYRPLGRTPKRLPAALLRVKPEAAPCAPDTVAATNEGSRPAPAKSVPAAERLRKRALRLILLALLLDQWRKAGLVGGASHLIKSLRARAWRRRAKGR